MTSDPTAIRHAQFVEIQHHLTRMMAYVTGRASIPVDENVIQNVVTLTNKPADQLSEDEQRCLWITFDALTRKVQPATPASIRIGLEYESNGQKRVDGTKPDHYARRGIRRALTWLATSMVMAFALQIYVSWGLSIVRDIEQTRQGMDQLREGIKTAVVADPKLKALVDGGTKREDRASPPTESSSAAQMELQSKLDKLRYNGILFHAQHDRLHHWRNLTLDWDLAWRSAIVSDADFKAAAELAKACDLESAGNKRDACFKEVDAIEGRAYNYRKVVEENALDLLVIVPATLLPLLFGLVGANAFILREYYERLRGMRLSEEVISYAHIRRWLGMILGVIVGVLFSAETISAKTGLTIVAVAFLAGYSVELAFNLMQALIDRIAAAVAPERRREPDENAAAPRTSAPPPASAPTASAPVIALASGAEPSKPAAA